MRKYFLGLVLLALVSGALSLFIVREGHPDLTAVGLSRHWKGEPFTGLIVDFHPNHRPALLATYWRGEHHGLEIMWYANGVREWERSYRHGVYHGTLQGWYENGRIKSWRSYVKGHAEGEQWGWNADGQVVEYNLFRNDQEIAHKTWTFDGKPFHNYVYQNGEKVGIMGEPFCKRKKQL